MGQDVRDLLGMRSAAGQMMTGVFVLACVVLAALTSGYTTLWWPLFLSAGILAAAAYVLVASAGDPMRLGQAVGVGAAGAGAVGVGLWTLELPLEEFVATWPMGMATLVFTFMCVRGRVLVAWLSFLAMIGVCVVWAVWTGQGAVHGVAMSFLNAGPLLMASFFAFTVRPLGRAIYQLREASTQRIAAEAATAAVLEARDAKLDELDQLARPLLERIATGAPLENAERMACELLEARLRDALRAPGLQRPDVVAAARAARSRGVTVVMLDDRGMDEAPAELHTRVADAVVAELEAVADGTVTVRILPPRRKTMATILVSGEQIRRVEFDRSGARLVEDELAEVNSPG